MELYSEASGLAKLSKTFAGIRGPAVNRAYNAGRDVGDPIFVAILHGQRVHVTNRTSFPESPDEREIRLACDIGLVLMPCRLRWCLH